MFRARVEPNPVRGEAFLRLSTTRAGWLKARLFDVSGREVRRLIDEPNAEPGERSLAIGGRRSGVRPGMYFYRVEAPEGTLRGRVVILE